MGKDRMTPNRKVVIRGDSNSFLDDPAVPYFLKVQMQKDEFLRLPLYKFDSRKFDPVLPDGISHPKADFLRMIFFQDGINTAGKTILDTNIDKAGEVPYSQAWVITKIETSIIPTQRVNIWQHEWFYWCLAQGILKFLWDDADHLQIPFSSALVGNPPHIGFISREPGDTPASWYDVNAPNTRLAGFAPKEGFTFLDAPICLRPGTKFRFEYVGNQEALDHLKLFLDDYYAKIGEDPGEFINDFFRMRIAIRGRKYIPIEKPL